MTELAKAEVAAFFMRAYNGLGVSRLSCFLLLACVLAQPAWAADVAPAGNSDVIQLLKKMQVAARQLDYAGVFTYQQGAAMQSNRVTHVVDGTGERERLEVLDGPEREFLRYNDTVQCLIPEKKLVLIEQRHAEQFPGVLIGSGKQVSDFYTLKTYPDVNRIAGRDCMAVELIPKDGYRYGYNFCIDTKTSLLIKSQTRHGHELIDQISFTSLQIGSSVQADQLRPSWNTRDWTIVKAPIVPVDLAGLGWRIALPPGFDSIAQVSRPMNTGKAVKQLVMSDGLAAISVFIEPYDPSQSQSLPNGPAHRGAMNIFGARIGDHWLTAIGEVPAQSLRELVERTEYVPAAAVQP